DDAREFADRVFIAALVDEELALVGRARFRAARFCSSSSDRAGSPTSEFNHQRQDNYRDKDLSKHICLLSRIAPLLFALTSPRGGEESNLLPSSASGPVSVHWLTTRPKITEYRCAVQSILMRFLIHRRMVLRNEIALGTVADRGTHLKKAGISVAAGAAHLSGPRSDHFRGGGGGEKKMRSWEGPNRRKKRRFPRDGKERAMPLLFFR